MSLTNSEIVEDMAHAVQSAILLGDTEIAMAIHQALAGRLGMESGS